MGRGIHQDETLGEAVLHADSGADRATNVPFAEYEYAAFISYRHLPHDQDVAKRVQRAIETFKMPRGVALPGRSDGRIGKCFRDEDELAAATSLPNRILEALANSSALIVICTPDTQGSIWVQREIEAFIDMRGRERVFAVLASGSSAESIPDLLRTEQANGDATTRSSPLAADLRPEAASKSREELLRIIAAIAGCGYDDLKQRDRTRKRKRNALAALVSLLIIALLIAAFSFASGARQDALAAESRALAAESAQLLAQGNRYGAIGKALEALPESEASNDRPLVPEARSALEDALQIEFDADHPWKLRYTIDAATDIASYKTSLEQGWIAILDSNLTLTFHDIDSGRTLSSVSLLDLLGESPSKEDLDPYNWIIAPARERLVVSERAGTCLLCCIEASTGSALWSSEVMANALSISNDGQTASVLCRFDETLYVGAIDISSGEGLGVSLFDNPGVPLYARPLPSCMGSLVSTLFVGFDTFVGRYDFADGTQAAAQIPESNVVTSLTRASDTVVATASAFFGQNPASPDDETTNVTVYATDDALQPLWSKNETWTFQSVDSQRGFVDVEQNPEAVGFTLVDEPVVAVIAGNAAEVLNANNGEALYKEVFAYPVVGISPLNPGDGACYLLISCANGSVYLRMLEGRSTAGGPVSFSYPGPVDCAQVEWHGNRGLFALARSLDDPSRLFVYRADDRTAQEARPASEYSLDDLIGIAHTELAAIAQ